MKIDVEHKQFDFETLKNGLLMVTYKPVMSRLDKKIYYTLFEQHTRYYQMAMECNKENANWVYLNYLADFVENHHGQIIPCI